MSTDGSATSFNAMDDFLGHSGSGRRGRFLKNWTKDGSVRIWLQTRQLPIAVWRHPFPQLVVFDDKDTRESKKAYWSRDQTCWESEGFLKEQYKRDENGNLEGGGPKHCVLCRIVDCVHRSVVSGKLDWCAPVFRFEGATDSKNDAILHAGGLTGMFNSDRLTERQKTYLKSKGLSQATSWRENTHAKMQYVICVVNNDEVRDGVQIATQTSLVGDQIKRVIRDTRASLGEDDGNPMLKPYCIELTYDERAPINKRYHARRIERIKLTPEIERLIRDEPPSLKGVTRPFNQRAIRAFLEQHCVVDLPWDDIFSVPCLEAAGEDDDDDVDRSFNHGHTPPKGVPAANESRPGGGRRATAPMIPCDKCKAPMREDAAQCDKCGATYEFDDESTTKAEPPPPGQVKGDRLPFGRF